MRQPGPSLLPVRGVSVYVKQQTILTQARPVLDEASFQQLLAAAYVLQRQNQTIIPPEAQTNYSQTLTYIAETQNQIQTLQLDLPAATMLIAEQVGKITQATGVAVGILEADQLVYWAGTGTAASEMGSRVPVASCLSAYCLHSGQILQCPDAKQDPRLRNELCQLRGVQSLIAVPVYYEGKVAGVLELRFAQLDSFREHEVRSSQLMAGLVSDSIARAAELKWKQSLATERASMLEALERIKPQLERLAEPSPTTVAETVPPGKIETEQAAAELCRGCGRQFGEEEDFCGTCGTARQAISSRGELQSKWASLWRMQQAQKQKRENLVEGPIATPDTRQGLTAPSLQQNLEDPPDEQVTTAYAASDSGVPNRSDAVPTEKSPWTSAARARRWLEELNAQQRPRKAWIAAHWRAYRANVYVGVAAFLLLSVILDWGFGPSQTGTSAASGTSTLSARHWPKKPELSLFEKLLVRLGVAEPPPSPAYAGNPQTQVWVDLHTALYYCPGADLYGKTEGGKLTTQRDAQQDQFEPASRKACD
jgi:GAF domain-containing protein